MANKEYSLDIQSRSLFDTNIKRFVEENEGFEVEKDLYYFPQGAHLKLNNNWVRLIARDLIPEQIQKSFEEEIISKYRVKNGRD